MHRETLFSNPYVEAYRITLAPGEAQPLHAGTQRIVYSLSDYTIRWTEDGETTSKRWREGEVHYHEALEHAAENTGNTIADFLVVARTDTPLPAVESDGDASAVAGGYATLIAEPADARVLRVALPAGARQPLHAGAPRLVYSLNDYSVSFITADGEVAEAELESGEMHWHDAGPHAVENTGDDTARFVIFAFH
ncbi:MAG: cupin domain-containing protein [Pseudohaliea sp.]